MRVGRPYRRTTHREHHPDSQKIEELIDTHGMSNCNPASSPYRSGHAIDRIPADNTPLEDKTPLVKKYQRLVGGLHCGFNDTCPEISTAVSLLSSYSHNPTADHYAARKRALAWLQGTLPWHLIYSGRKFHFRECVIPDQSQFCLSHL